MFKSDKQRKFVMNMFSKHNNSFAKIHGYHGSRFGPDYPIKPGFNIGTKKAALDRIKYHSLDGGPISLKDSILIEYEGDFNNPYKVDDIVLDERHGIDYDMVKILHPLFTKESAKELLSCGFDYVPYINTVEDYGSKSFVILDPSKLNELRKINIEDKDVHKLYNNKFTIVPEDIAYRRFGRKINDFEYLGHGRDREVYVIDDDKVMKIAKKAPGLEQNRYEGDYVLGIIPELHERGEDYVVVERANRNDLRTKKFLKPLKEFAYLNTSPFTNSDSERLHKFQDELYKLDNEYGTDAADIVANYGFIYNDFANHKNWGWKNDMPKLVDAGVLSTDSLWADDEVKADWREALRERRKAKKELGL